MLADKFGPFLCGWMACHSFQAENNINICLVSWNNFNPTIQAAHITATLILVKLDLINTIVVMRKNIFTEDKSTDINNGSRKISLLNFCIL